MPGPRRGGAEAELAVTEIVMLTVHIINIHLMATIMADKCLFWAFIMISRVDHED